MSHFDAGKDADEPLRAKVAAQLSEAAPLREEMAQAVTRSIAISDGTVEAGAPPTEAAPE